VEDEPDARMIFKSLIEINTPYKVLEAGNGISALEMAEKNHDIDLILLDVVMPQLGGIEVLKTIKENPEKYGTPKVVMLTNLTSDESQDKAEEYHTDGYLTKVKMEPEVLIKEIEKYIR